MGHTAPQIFIDPQNGDILFANPAAEAFYGYTIDELRRMKIGEINQLSSAKITENLKRAADQQVATFLFPHRLKNGVIRMVEVRTGPVTVQGRKILHSFINDATEKVAAEEDLKERERQLRTLSANLPGALVQMAPTSLGDWMPTFFSTGAADLLGLDLDTLLNNPFPPKDIFAPGHREKLKEVLKTAAEIHGPVNTSFAVLHPGGHKKWMHLSATPRQEEKALVWDGLMMDITPQVRARQHLNRRIRTEKLLADISSRLLNAPPGELDATLMEVLALLGRFFEADRVWLLQSAPDADTGTNDFYDGTHEWCAQGIAPVLHTMGRIGEADYPWWFKTLREHHQVYLPDMSHLPPEAIHEKKIYVPLHFKSLISLPVIWQGQQHGFVEIVRVRHEKKWSERKIMLFRMVCDLLAGAISRHRSGLALQESEEERRSTQQALWQSQKLESLGLLAGGVAHDFNNLLLGIQGYLELALMKLPPDHPAVKNLEKSQKAGEKAASLCKQLLAYAGKEAVSPTPVCLSAVLLETKLLIESTLPPDLLLVVDVPADLPAVLSDASLLSQVILNLVINAQEAMGRTPGVITLKAGVAAPASHKSHLHLGQTEIRHPMGYFRVTDNGPGMDAATLNRVFDPFFSTKGHGRGLGLAAVAGIVKNLGGAISVFSEPGQGASFSVFLPLAPEAADAGAPTTAEAGEVSLHNRCLLVVDQEPAVVDLIKEALSGTGAEIFTAGTPSEAARLQEQLAPRLGPLLVDLTLAKNHPELTHHRPLVLMSGYRAAEAGDLLKAPDTWFLAKPFTSSQLKQVLSRASKAR